MIEALYLSLDDQIDAELNQPQMKIPEHQNKRIRM